MPLSEAEKNLPSGVNPLALHIMRLTTEFSRYCGVYVKCCVYILDSQRTLTLKQSSLTIHGIY